MSGVQEHTPTHTLALISPHFNLGPVTTMRLPTSDSKLFLFNEKKKHPVFLSGKNEWRPKQKEEECVRVCVSVVVVGGGA